MLSRSRRPHEHIRRGEAGQVRRSPQAVAGRKRGVEARGRPQTFLPVENAGVWSTALEARQGKPGDGTRLEPERRGGTGCRQVEESGHRESPPYAAGESYRAEDSEVGTAHDTGKVSPEARSPARTRIPDMSDRSSMSKPPCGPEHTGFHPARMRVQPRNRMRANCTSGTARGVPGNRHSYRGGSARRKSEAGGW